MNKEFTTILLILSLASITCVIGAIIILLQGMPGWGWFLFVAWLTSPSSSHIKQRIIERGICSNNKNKKDTGDKE